MWWASPWSMQSFWKIAHNATNYFRLCVRLPALGCRVGKQRNDNGVRLGLRGCLRRFAGKSSSDGNVPKVWEAGNTDLIGLFQICSSTAFGLASPPVSLKPSGLDHCRERKTNPRASLSHCVRSRASRAEKSCRDLRALCLSSLSARSLGMV
jgi:hypothetical protein